MQTHDRKIVVTRPPLATGEVLYALRSVDNGYDEKHRREYAPRQVMGVAYPDRIEWQIPDNLRNRKSIADQTMNPMYTVVYPDDTSASPAPARIDRDVVTQSKATPAQKPEVSPDSARNRLASAR